MALIKCLECGQEISDKASICIHCGCPINKENNNENNKEDIKCPECGNTLNKTDTICNKCGFPIKENTTTNKEIKKDNNTNEKKNEEINILKDEQIISKTTIDENRINKVKTILIVITIVTTIIVVLIATAVATEEVPIYNYDSYSYYSSYSYGPTEYRREINKPIFLIILLPTLFTTYLVNILIYISLNKYKKNYLILTNKRIKGAVYAIGMETMIDIPIDKINTIISTKSFYNINGLSISSAFYRTYHLNYILNSDEFREKAIKVIDENKEQ